VNAFDNFPDARLLEVKNATEKNASSQSMTELILNGWPEDKDRVPNYALPFFDMRDELSVVDGVIVKGEAPILFQGYAPLSCCFSFAVSIPDIFHSCQRVVLRLS
jgi:hypothetical protein